MLFKLFTLYSRSTKRY